MLCVHRLAFLPSALQIVHVVGSVVGTYANAVLGCRRNAQGQEQGQAAQPQPQPRPAPLPCPAPAYLALQVALKVTRQVQVRGCRMACLWLPVTLWRPILLLLVV